MITRQKERYGWEFLFLGANIDAVGTAAGMGISADRAARFHSDSRGTQTNYRAMDQALRSVRSNAPLSAEWKAEVEADYRSRS